MLITRLLITFLLILGSTSVFALDTDNTTQTTNIDMGTPTVDTMPSNVEANASVSTLKDAAAPSACPAIADLQAAGLAKALWDAPDNMWVVGQNNNYKLPQVWAFIIGVPSATSADQAMQMAMAGLATLSNQPTTPVFLKPQGYWFCGYTISNGLQAMAVTENDPYAKFYGVSGLIKPAH